MFVMKYTTTTTCRYFFLPYPRKKYRDNTNGIKNNMSELVKIQLLTMEMINRDLTVFIFFTSPPFVVTSTLVAERL